MHGQEFLGPQKYQENIPEDRKLSILDFFDRSIGNSFRIN
jgi:hypothetical protein